MTKKETAHPQIALVPSAKTGLLQRLQVRAHAQAMAGLITGFVNNPLPL